MGTDVDAERRAPVARVMGIASGAHYDVLQVAEDCSEADIKRAYRALVLLVHPDRNRHANAEAAFKIVAAAYETLVDPTERAAYDADRRMSQFARGFAYGRAAARAPAPRQAAPEQSGKPQTRKQRRRRKEKERARTKRQSDDVLDEAAFFEYLFAQMREDAARAAYSDDHPQPTAPENNHSSDANGFNRYVRAWLVVLGLVACAGVALYLLVRMAWLILPRFPSVLKNIPGVLVGLGGLSHVLPSSTLREWSLKLRRLHNIVRFIVLVAIGYALRRLASAYSAWAITLVLRFVCFGSSMCTNFLAGAALWSTAIYFSVTGFFTLLVLVVPGYSKSLLREEDRQ